MQDTRTCIRSVRPWLDHVVSMDSHSAMASEKIAVNRKWYHYRTNLFLFILLLFQLCISTDNVSDLLVYKCHLSLVYFYNVQSLSTADRVFDYIATSLINTRFSILDDLAQTLENGRKYFELFAFAKLSE